jgi:hypothetical protein
MPIRRRLVVVSALLIAALVPSNASAEGTSHFLVELSPEAGPTEVHPCNGENLVLEGRIALTFHEVDTSGDGSHVNGNGVLQGVSATSIETGAVYRLVGASPFVFNSNGASTVTITGTRRIVGRGAVDDFVLRSHLHITINQEGKQRATVVRSVLECL